jgi:hypothetical protein
MTSSTKCPAYSFHFVQKLLILSGIKLCVWLVVCVEFGGCCVCGLVGVAKIPFLESATRFPAIKDRRHARTFIPQRRHFPAISIEGTREPSFFAYLNAGKAISNAQLQISSLISYMRIVRGSHGKPDAGINHGSISEMFSNVIQQSTSRCQDVFFFFFFFHQMFSFESIILFLIHDGDPGYT